MSTKTRNTPLYAGAMTPAELTKRTLDRLAFIAGATALTAVSVFILIFLLML